ncbi:MAG: histidine kinase [Breznakiellaceae bacterium]
MGRKTTVLYQHTVAFVFLVALPVALVLLFISFIFRTELIRIAQQQTSEAVTRTAQNLDTEAMNFALFTSALMNDEILQEQVKQFLYPQNSEQKYLAARGIEKSISWFFRITSRIGSVFLFFRDGGHFQYSNYPSDTIDYETIREICMDPRRADGEVWPLDTVSALPGAIEKPPVLSMVVRPRLADKKNSSISAILVSFRVPLLDSFLFSGQQNGATRILVNTQNKVILSDNKALYNQPYEIVKAGYTKSHIVIESPIEHTGWLFAEVIPIHFVTHRVDIMMRWVLGALFLIALLFGFYSRAFFSDIIKPLRAVILQMEEFAGGNFSVRVQETGPEEFRELGSSFNSMVNRIDELTKRIMQEQKEKARLEIEALRFQLNPHFICNTLTSINMMASLAKVEPIKKMTTALIRVVQETLLEEGTIVPIERELKNLESYVYIMRVRFGDTFTYEVQTKGDFQGIGIPTMLIQPLIENAILHGMRGRNTGNIVLSITRNDPYLLITVQDDGNGIPFEKQEELFALQKDGKRGLNKIGLYNIRRRVVLSYEPPCDVSIESWPGEGTLVKILIPLLSVENQ